MSYATTVGPDIQPDAAARFRTWDFDPEHTERVARWEAFGRTRTEALELQGFDNIMRTLYVNPIREQLLAPSPFTAKLETEGNNEPGGNTWQKHWQRRKQAVSRLWRMARRPKSRRTM